MFYLKFDNCTRTRGDCHNFTNFIQDTDVLDTVKVAKLTLTMLVWVLASCVSCSSQISKSSPPDQNSSVAVDWTKVQSSVAKGKVEAFEIDDSQYKAKRKIWVYTPANYDKRSPDAYDLLISFDGQDYVNDIPSPTINDNLIAAGKIRPVVQIFVDNSVDRLGDLANRQKFADFIAKDLVPWAQKNFHVTTDAKRTTLCGYSAGGLGTAYVAFRYPGIFGNVLSQSGAFWRGNEGTSEPSEWLTSQYQSSPKLDIKFYLVVGAAETIKNASGKSMVETSCHLRDVLKAKGYTVGYLEYPNGVHSPEFWRAELADGLIFLLGKQ